MSSEVANRVLAYEFFGLDQVELDHGEETRRGTQHMNHAVAPYSSVSTSGQTTSLFAVRRGVSESSDLHCLRLLFEVKLKGCSSVLPTAFAQETYTFSTS